MVVFQIQEIDKIGFFSECKASYQHHVFSWDVVLDKQVEYIFLSG